MMEINSDRLQKNAVVLLDKKSGITSFDCLRTVKRYVNRKTGHCGTLDRFASGLLIAVCGKCTKLNPEFMGLDKTYEAEIVFGKETETLDPEGEIVCTSGIPDISKVETVVSEYVGTVMQVPPAYSAIHVNGKRSYQIARSGQSVSLEERQVTIHSADIDSYADGVLHVRLRVSKGTYVRSYARDIGRLCGSCAFVNNLRRIKIGPFDVSEAVLCDDVSSIINISDDSEELISRLVEYRKCFS